MPKVTMDAQDKHTSEVKSLKSAEQSKRLVQYVRFIPAAIVVVLLIVLVVLALPHLQNLQKTSRSNKLIGNITTLENGRHQCADGIKQLKSVTPKLADSSYYTDAAREKALNYLMPCSFMQSDSKKALVYANQLGQVYDHEGLKKNTAKQAQLAEFVTYMKGYK